MKKNLPRTKNKERKISHEEHGGREDHEEEGMLKVRGVRVVRGNK